MIPLNNFIIVEIQAEQEETESGIVLAESREVPTNNGKVIASSYEGVEEGDVVVLPIVQTAQGPQINAMPIMSKGKKYLAVKGEDIVAKL